MTGEHQRGVELIESAFAAARNTGSPDWRSMTSAVLKNRILDLTDREFDEADWGADSFRAFLGQFDDILRVDPSKRPAQVTLLEERSSSTVGSAPSPVLDLGRERQIRRDLWNAVMDFSSGCAYGWDCDRAVPIGLDDTSDMLLLPTLSKEEFKGWREDFVKRQVADGTDAETLDLWLKQEGAMKDLPGGLRIKWVVELKRRVLERLQGWFSEKNSQPPSDLIVDEEERGSDDASTEALRELVLATVRAMNADELQALCLPPAAVLRSRR